MMRISVITNNCYYVLMIISIASTCAYVIDSDDLRNSLVDQSAGLNMLSFDGRYIRATKFPRIGRSPSDIHEISSIYDVNGNMAENEEMTDDNGYQWIDRRSYLLPRIGKRAFHNLPRKNSLSNPYQLVDAQDRYYANGYDYRVHQNHSPFITHHRGKRNLPM